MLCRYRPTSVFNIVHDEGLDNAFHSSLKLMIFVSRNHNIYVQVSISDMAVTMNFDSVSFTFRQLSSVLDLLSQFSYALVKLGRRKTDIIVQRETV
jgi:hypothetical protein